jgi:hypothetical protein
VLALLVSSVLVSLAVAPLAAIAGEPSGRWSHRFEPATNMTAPLAVLDGKLVGGQHRFKDGEWKLLGDGIQPRPTWIDAVIADGKNLYVSGSHSVEDALWREFVAKWDGNDWTLLPIESYSRCSIIADRRTPPSFPSLLSPQCLPVPPSRRETASRTVTDFTDLCEFPMQR